MVVKNLVKSVSKTLTTEEIEQCKQFAKALFESDINLDRTNIIVVILLTIKNNKNIINDIDKENVLNVIVLSFIDIYHFENLQSLKKILPHNYNCYDDNDLALFYDICVFVKSCVDRYGNDILVKIYEAIDIYDSNNRLKGNKESMNILYGEDVCDMMVNRTFDCYYKLNGYKNDVEYVDFCVDRLTLSKVSKFTSNYSVCDDYVNIKNTIYYYKMLLDGFNPERIKKDSINDNGNYDISIIKLNRFKNKNNNYVNTTYEHQQILKQIRLLKIGGIGCCMIPWYDIYDNSPECITFRTELLKNVKILSCYAVYDNLLEFMRDEYGYFNVRPIIACCMIIYQKIEKLDNPVKQVINDSANYLYCGYNHSDIENIKRNYPHNEGKFTIDIKDNIIIDYYRPSVINKVECEIKTEEQFKIAFVDNIRVKIDNVIDYYFGVSTNDNSNVNFTNEINNALDINNSKVYKWEEYQIEYLIKKHNICDKFYFSDSESDSDNELNSESESDSNSSDSENESDSEDEIIYTDTERIKILLEHKFGTCDWKVIKKHLKEYIKYPRDCWCNKD